MLWKALMLHRPVLCLSFPLTPRRPITAPRERPLGYLATGLDVESNPRTDVVPIATRRARHPLNAPS